MKNQMKKKSGLNSLSFLAVILILGLNSGCQKNDVLSPVDNTSIDPKLMNSNYAVVSLVGDNTGYDPAFIDPSLVNAWGLAFDEGEIWVSSTEDGSSGVYDANGNTIMPHVTIPGLGGMTGSPTGVVYNSTGKFIIPATGEKSEFIFCTEDGTIAAWASGGSAITVANRSAFGTVYKGITISRKEGIALIYATDFHNGRVDVYDQNFEYQEGFSFIDPDMAAGFAPFNIRYIDGLLYVTYAKQLAPENIDDEAGPGNGYINLFELNGTFGKRFASNGSLNSPWGIQQTDGNGLGAILVGNFGDGRISVFAKNGAFKSFLQSDGMPIEIEGLWALVMPEDNILGVPHNRIYFTAGPDDEEHGLFGYLDPQ